MGTMSPLHWLVVLVIVLLVFGPKRLASLGKGLGEGIRSFREGISGEGERHDDAKAIQKDKPTDQGSTPS